MRKIRALVGLPVIADGKRIGRVIQAEISADLSELTGLWISKGFFAVRFIPAESIGTIGEVSVIADDGGVRKRCRSASFFYRAVGTDGSRIGAITGAEFDELSFRILSLELTCGIWDDLFAGRRWVQQFTVNQENGNVVVDVSEIEKEVQRK